jgi:porphobilinogen synthase
LDEKKIVIETLTAFKRAGADLIITYFAPEAAQWIKNQS